jgi:hypothetical protein
MQQKHSRADWFGSLFRENRGSLSEEVLMLARILLRGALAFLLAGSIAAPLSASTFRRAGLEELVRNNTTVVIGEVLEAKSYWDDEEGFILTDVRIKATEVLKGDPRDDDFTITLLGGTVGDMTTVIVGSPELIPRKSYLLFLKDFERKSTRSLRTVPDYTQGVFDIVRARDGVRAISQAHRVRLVPDALGFVDPPGKSQGLLLENIKQSIREIAARDGVRREVK